MLAERALSSGKENMSEHAAAKKVHSAALNWTAN
jgi:hypothetical protein